MNSQSLLIDNGDVFTSHRFIKNGAVLIRGNKIVAVGERSKFARVKNAKVIDAHGGIIMPGFINLHTHLYSSLARGMPMAGKPAANFNEILKTLWWRLDRLLTDEDVFYSALVGLIDAVKSGTTSIVDHHSSPNCVAGSLWCISAALEVVPVRASLSYEVSDRDGAKIRDLAIEENVLFARSHMSNQMLRPMMGLHASFTLSDETIARAVELADALGIGCHVHTAEAQSDVEFTRKKFGERVVERWKRLGVLSPKSLLAHCVHIDEREARLIASSQAKIAHNPSSNMNNAVGSADLQMLIKRHCAIGLGTDGMSQDMILEAKVAALGCKAFNGATSKVCFEAGGSLLNHNPDICRKLFGWRIGALDAGSMADVITVDYRSPTPVNPDNFLSHLLYGVHSGNVRSSIINGRVVMHDRHLPGVDEKQIFSEAEKVAMSLWKRFKKGGLR